MAEAAPVTTARTRLTRALHHMTDVGFGRLGLELRRKMGDAERLVTRLKERQISMVLDVGANRGQFASALRRAGFAGHIHSFEPTAEAFASLARASSSDPLWTAWRIALGDSSGTVMMNVAGNAAESSSVLPMLQAHVDAAPYASYVAAEEVPLSRLDDVIGQLDGRVDSSFIKIDVQGYEREVLAGSPVALRACRGLQLELTLTPLYEGGLLVGEALELAAEFGLFPHDFTTAFADPLGRLLQVDGTFFRS